MKKPIGLSVIFLCLIMVLAGFSIHVDAVTYVQITSAMQVVDSLNGVDAVYRPNSADGSDGTYSCAAYVHRYYSSVYEVTVSNLLTGRVPAASRGSFSVTNSPEPGDIGYQTNSKGSGHWFIIKKVNGDGTYTVIEQNFKKDYANTAPVGRVVGPSTSGFKVYRWSLKGPTHIPYGAVDGIEGGTGTIRIYGWAKDDDAPDTALNIHVYIDGPAGVGNCIKSDIIAGNASSDVGKHRFDVTFATDYVGEHTIYVYAINAGAGNHNPLLDGSPQTVNIKELNHVPYGALDGAEGLTGRIRVYGWAKDDDEPDTALTIHVYIDGPAGIGKCITDFTAGNDSPDVGKHRFDIEFPTDYVGEHTIYVYAINAGAGNHNPMLDGCPRTVNIKERNHVPYGALDIAEGLTGKIRVYGWAKDDDEPDQALTIQVYIDGPAGTGKCIKSNITAGNNSSDVGKHRFDVTFDTDYTGSHAIYVYAVNTGAGNQNTLLNGCPKTVTITAVDKERPTVEGCALSAVTDKKCRLTLNARDNVGVDNVKVRLRNKGKETVYQASRGSGNQWTCDLSYDLTDGGNAVAEAEVYDAAGNFAVVPATTNKVCVYAEIHQETVSFDANGGTGAEQSRTVLYSRLENRVKGSTLYYSPYGTLPSAARTGYDFEGWYTASSGGSLVTGSDMVKTESDHTLYARWKEKVFTVTYVSEGEAAVPGPQTKTWSTNLVLSEDIPVRNGYIFIGWIVGDTLYQPGDYFYLNVDTVLTAVWEKIPDRPDMVLPDNLTVIEEEAFEESVFIYVVIPEGTAEIGPGAFADCPNLRFVQFQGSSTHIDDSAFNNSDIVILAPEGSDAILWARENGIHSAVR